jgi:predicted nucleic acid-binding protein
MTFVDTSALLALIDADDRHHADAAAAFERLRDPITHSYVVVESIAVAQRRFGVPGMRALTDQLLALLEIAWVDPELHAVGVATLLAANRRSLSLVDAVSFELMRRRRIDVAFAFDRHFQSAGFRTL